MGAGIQHSFDDSKWSDALRTGLEHARDFTQPNSEAGEVMIGVVQRNFENQGGPNQWPELSPATLLARARGRSGKGVALGYGHNAGPATKREAAVLDHAQRLPGFVRRIHGVGESGPLGLTKRARDVIANAKPLVWTGRLLRSVTKNVARMYVDVGSNLPQAARLWFGSRAGVNPPTPARDPFGRTPEDNHELELIYKLWIWAQGVR